MEIEMPPKAKPLDVKLNDYLYETNGLKNKELENLITGFKSDQVNINDFLIKIKQFPELLLTINGLPKKDIKYTTEIATNSIIITYEKLELRGKSIESNTPYRFCEENVKVNLDMYRNGTLRNIAVDKKWLKGIPYSISNLYTIVTGYIYSLDQFIKFTEFFLTDLRDKKAYIYQDILYSLNYLCAGCKTYTYREPAESYRGGTYHTSCLKTIDGKKFPIQSIKKCDMCERESGEWINKDSKIVCGACCGE